jgi:signal transduction histidine kinase
MFNSDLTVIWRNRPDGPEEWLRFPAPDGPTIPREGEERERWPVARVLRGDPRAARIYTTQDLPEGCPRPEFQSFRVAAWTIRTPHGLLVIEETETIDAPEEDTNRLRQLDQNIEDLLHSVLTCLQRGADSSNLRLPNPCIAVCDGIQHCSHDVCPVAAEDGRVRCWELSRLPDAGDEKHNLLERFEACSRCPVFGEASPDPMIRISENFNRLLSLLQLKHEESLDVQHRMQQADKLAIMGELLASIAHEIKNPLGIIIGRLDVLGLEMEGLAPDDLADDLSTIHQQANRVRQIVDHLLRMARPEPPMFHPVNMNAVIVDCLAMVRKNLADRHISVVTDLDPHLPTIQADQIQMQQVLLNLILNARDAMEEGGTLAITSAPVRGKLPGVRIAVADTGPGIAPEQRERLFSSFNTTKLEMGGTGLGLSVCRRIMAAHQGRIEADSAAGKGTTMRLWLPAGRRMA